MLQAACTQRAHMTPTDTHTHTTTSAAWDEKKVKPQMTKHNAHTTTSAVWDKKKVKPQNTMENKCGTNTEYTTVQTNSTQKTDNESLYFSNAETFTQHSGDHWGGQFKTKRR